MDTSHEKLESMPELDAMNVCGLSQDLTQSDSPFCMETSSTTSDLPQNEMNVKRESEYKSILSEDICNTLDNLLGDINTGNYIQNVLIQPIDTSISSLRPFEPICKFHWIEAFNDEMTTFQNLTDDLTYTERPELQSYVYSNAKDTVIKQDSFKENPMETSISTNKDQLASECVRQLTTSQPFIHCSGETLKFTERSLAESTAKESALDPKQPESFLYETAVSSKEVQNSGEIPEMPVSHQKEITADGTESPWIASTWSPAGTFWSSGTSLENCRAPEMEQSFESLQPLEEDMCLNEVLWKLKCTNREQQTQIQDLQYSNLHLKKKVKELQTKITKQHVFLDIINKLKENAEELIEDKYRIILEKNHANKTLQNLQEILANTEEHLQESGKEKETLQLELKKIKASYICLQERYMTEMQQKNKFVSQCIEMDKVLSKKEDEVKRLQHLKGKLEKATTSALDLLKRKKEFREQEFLSLQEEFRKRETENLEERQKLKSKLDKLVVQVKNLQFTCESEGAKNTELQQQINTVKNENAALQQQIAKSKEQNYVPKFQIAQLQEQLEEVMEPDATKDITIPGAEHFRESEKVSDILLQNLKSFYLKKKNLDEELLKHKDKITTLRELIANEKAFQDHIIEVRDFDSNEAKNVRDVPIILAAKLDKYHNLNEELDFLITKLGNLVESKEDHCNRLIEENDKYQRQLGNLINKVTSYEEIIECADQRLELSHSQIAHLEERNKHLEDLIRKPRERARKLRPRKLESHPKSMTTMPDIFKGNKNDID